MDKIIEQTENNKSGNKKNKAKKTISKILLLISLTPYIFLLGYGVYSMVFGFGFLGSYTYGLEAFADSIFIMGVILCIYPVIPLCAIYQLIYFIVNLIKNKHKITKKSVIRGIIITVLILIFIAVFCARFY